MRQVFGVVMCMLSHKPPPSSSVSFNKNAALGEHMTDGEGQQVPGAVAMVSLSQTRI